MAATVITFNQSFDVGYRSAHKNMAGVHSRIQAQVTSLAVDAMKVWEDTRTVHMGGLTAQVHDHGYERTSEIVGTTITNERTKTRNRPGKPPSWEWNGVGSCAIKVNSFAEDAPA
jgi:hypothetical protein